LGERRTQLYLQGPLREAPSGKGRKGGRKGREGGVLIKTGRTNNFLFFFF